MGLNFGDIDFAGLDLQIGSDVGAGIDIDAAIAAALGDLNIPDVSGFTTPQDVQGLIGQEIGGLAGQFSTPQSVQQAIQQALGQYTPPTQPQQDISGLATTEQLGQQGSGLMDMLTGGLSDIRGFLEEQIGSLSSLFGGQFGDIWSTVTSNQQDIQSGTIQQTQSDFRYLQPLHRQ